MPPITITTILQVIIGLGLLNVWLLRASSTTPYRGGRSKTLAEEFSAYGLPTWSFYLIGFLKVGSALLLLAGLWMSAVVAPAAGLVVILMIGALAMHLKVKDPISRSVPALAMLAMSGLLFGLQIA